MLSNMVLRSYSENGSFSNFLPFGTTVTPEKTKEFFDTFWLKYFNGLAVSPDKPAYTFPYNVPTPYSYLNGTVLDTYIYTTYAGSRIYFTTKDGIGYFVIDLSYDSEGKPLYGSQQRVYIDINGITGPNVFGKDIFLFIINAVENTVKPACYQNTKTDVDNNCKGDSTNVSSGECCLQKIINDGWKIKDDYPW